MSLDLIDARKLKIYYQHVVNLRATNKSEKLVKLLLEDDDSDLIILTNPLTKDDHWFMKILEKDFEVLTLKDDELVNKIIIARRKESKFICSNIQENFTSNSSEVDELWIKITSTDNLEMHMCVCNLKTNCKKENFQNFFQSLKKHLEVTSRNFLIFGNFNFSDFNAFKSGAIKIRKQGTKLDVMNRCTKGLRQVNNTQACNANELLDLVLTSIATATVEKSNFELVKAEDKHPPLRIEVNIQQPQVENNRNAKLENEIQKLRKSFESFKVAHEEEIKSLRNEIRTLRVILEDDGIL